MDNDRYSYKKNKGKNKHNDITHRKEYKNTDQNTSEDYTKVLLSSLGNSNISNMMNGGIVQAKLKVSSPGSFHEMQADKVAEQVVKSDSSQTAPPKIDTIQAKGSSEGTVPKETAAGINKLKGKGSSLNHSVRDYFEPRYGKDLGNVRVHTGNDANNLAESINAKAFTTGNDIIFAKGEYQPGTREGKKLIAHELTHTIQQDKGSTEIHRKAEDKKDEKKPKKDSKQKTTKTTITESVGKGGTNTEEDTQIVQKLINKHLSKMEGVAKLKEDGICGQKTIDAIVEFQKQVAGFQNPDGLISPGKKTWSVLKGGAEPKKEEKPEAPAEEKKGFFQKVKGFFQKVKDFFGFGKEKEKSKKDTEKKEKKEKKEAPAKEAGNNTDRVTGKKSGVKAEIINLVQAVAAHYNTTININSGLRTPNEQGEIMYKYWVSNLKRGKLYYKLKTDTELQQKLDNLYKKAQKGDAQAKKDFVANIAKDAHSYSRHVSGQAIDIPKNTPQKIRNALKTGLREVAESLCYHYDNRGIKTPTVTKELKAKWK